MIKHSWFKRLAAASLLAATASLGACAGGVGVLQNDIATIESQVQTDANVLCGFIPTAATIASFIPGFGSVAVSAATIAEGICTAISKAPVVAPASAARMKAVASGADIQVATTKTPSGQVAIVGHFTR